MSEAPEIVSPFQRKYYNAEEDRVTSSTVNIRFNAKERDMLDEIKTLLNTNQDGSAIKIAARIGLNVLHVINALETTLLRGICYNINKKLKRSFTSCLF